MKIKREFSREQLSAKVLDFCGNISVYLVEEKVIPAKKGKQLLRYCIHYWQFSNGKIRKYSRMMFATTACQAAGLPV